MLQTTEYRGLFSATDNSWQVYQAPDYNYNNGEDYIRYLAARSRPTGFTNIPGGSRTFSENIAKSVAGYYDAFCYRGTPCIDNPELARGKTADLLLQSPVNNAHACGDPANLNSQFKWVAINGTTYPQGINSDTVCFEDAYFKINRLSLERYDCDANYTNCRRNQSLDLTASRSGQDNDGNPAYFFRDGSRLALIQVNRSAQQPIDTTNNSVTIPPQDPLLTNTLPAANAHACADPSQTNSRYTWQSASRTAESKGIGTTVICMDDYYYSVQRKTLLRHNCDNGFVNCRPDPDNNLTAQSSKRVNGNPALVFGNGVTLTLTARNVAPATPSANTGTRTNNQNRQRSTVNQSGTQTRTQAPTSTASQQAYSGADCADAKKRLSQFRWKSQGLSSWPDGIDGRFICLNDSYYEVTASSLRNYSCQRNYSNCRANPAKNVTVSQVSQDGTVWTLNNGDQVTLISK